MGYKTLFIHVEYHFQLFHIGKEKIVNSVAIL